MQYQAGDSDKLCPYAGCDTILPGGIVRIDAETGKIVSFITYICDSMNFFQIIDK